MHRNPSEIGASTPQTLARVVLAGLMALAVGLLVLPLGLSFAQSSSQIDTVNPAPGSSTVVSSKDFPYHFSAWVDNVPPSPFVEFRIKDGNNTVVASLNATQTAGSSDTFEAFWTIPASINDGSYTLETFLFRNFTGPGTGELADSDTQAITIDNKPEPGPLPGTPETPAGENVTIDYPVNGGPLGVNVPRSGSSTFVIEGKASSGTSTVQPFYTVSRPGTEPSFKSCGGNTTATDTNNDGIKDFRLICTIAAGDFPLSVTGVSVVPTRTTGPLPPQSTKGASDGHRVKAYFQRPASVTIDPSTRGNAATGTCQKFVATVRDQNGRQIAGTNVDVHAVGPDDALRFDVGTAFSDRNKAPDKGDHASDAGIVCNASGNQSGQGAAGSQGAHVVPAGPDIKHIESVDGTDAAGQFEFSVFSSAPGTTQITAWADFDDDDLICASEPRGAASVGWGPDNAAPTPVAEEPSVQSCPVPDPSPSPSPSPTPTRPATASPTGSPTATPTSSPTASPTGSPGPDPDPVKHRRNVEITDFKHVKLKNKKKKALQVSGVVEAPSFGECRQAVPIKVQLRADGEWVTRKSDFTNDRGRFKVLIRDVSGKYRAVATKVEKVDEDTNTVNVCRRAADTARHRHKR